MANSSTIPLPALQYLRSRTHPPASSLYLFFQHPYLLVQFGNSFIGDGQQLYSILPWSITEETVLSTYTVTKHSSLSLRRCYMGRFLNNKALQHFCDIVSYGCNIVPTLLPKKSLLQIISCNITVHKNWSIKWLHSNYKNYQLTSKNNQSCKPKCLKTFGGYWSARRDHYILKRGRDFLNTT